MTTFANPLSDLIAATLKGGPGSGFRGHRGRPGQWGGSLPRSAVPEGIGNAAQAAAVARVPTLSRRWRSTRFYDVPVVERSVDAGRIAIVTLNEPVTLDPTDSDRRRLGAVTAWLNAKYPLWKAGDPISPQRVGDLMDELAGVGEVAILLGRYRRRLHEMNAAYWASGGQTTPPPAPARESPAAAPAAVPAPPARTRRARAPRGQRMILPEIASDSGPMTATLRSLQEKGMPDAILQETLYGPQADPRYLKLVQQTIVAHHDALTQSLQEARAALESQNRGTPADPDRDRDALLTGTHVISHEEMMDSFVGAMFPPTLESVRRDPSYGVRRAMEMLAQTEATIAKLRAGESVTPGREYENSQTRPQTVRDLFLRRKAYQELLVAGFGLLAEQGYSPEAIQARIEAAQGGDFSGISAAAQARIRNFQQGLAQELAHPARANLAALEAQLHSAQANLRTYAPLADKTGIFQATIDGVTYRAYDRDLAQRILGNLDVYAYHQSEVAGLEAAIPKIRAFEQARQRPLEAYPNANGLRDLIATYRGLRERATELTNPNVAASGRLLTPPFALTPLDIKIQRERVVARDELATAGERALRSEDLNEIDTVLGEMRATMRAKAAQAKEIAERIAEVEGGLNPAAEADPNSAFHAVGIEWTEAINAQIVATDWTNRLHREGTRLHEQQLRQEQAEENARREAARARRALDRAQRRAALAAENQEAVKKLEEKGITPEMLTTVDGIKKIIRENAGVAAIRAVTPLTSDPDYLPLLADNDEIETADRILSEATDGICDSASDLIASAYEFHHPGSGLSAVVDRVHTDGSAIEVRGSVRDRTNNEVGSFTRYIHPDGTVINDYFRINERYQNQGFGSAFYQHAEEAYVAAGLKKIRIHANLSVGGYSWARMGFDTNSAEERDFLLTRARERWERRYSLPFPKITHLYELAALVGPDEQKIGKEVLLGTDWVGTKILNDSNDGFDFGLLYYTAKAQGTGTQKEIREESRLARLLGISLKGGPGSGFFGHRGRPGKWGGSRPRDAAATPKAPPLVIGNAATALGEIRRWPIGNDHTLALIPIPVERYRQLLSDSHVEPLDAATHERYRAYLDALAGLPDPNLPAPTTRSGLQARLDDLDSRERRLRTLERSLDEYINRMRYRSQEATARDGTNPATGELLAGYAAIPGELDGYFSSYSMGKLIDLDRAPFAITSDLAGPSGDPFKALALRQMLKEQRPDWEAARTTLRDQFEAARNAARLDERGRALLAGTAQVSFADVQATPWLMRLYDQELKSLKKDGVSGLQSAIRGIAAFDARIERIRGGDLSRLDSHGSYPYEDDTVTDTFLRREAMKEAVRQGFAFLKRRERKSLEALARLEALNNGETVAPYSADTTATLEAIEARTQEHLRRPRTAGRNYYDWSIEERDRAAQLNDFSNDVIEVEATIDGVSYRVTGSNYTVPALQKMVDRVIVARAEAEGLRRERTRVEEFQRLSGREVEEYPEETGERAAMRIYRTIRHSNPTYEDAPTSQVDWDLNPHEQDLTAQLRERFTSERAGLAAFSQDDYTAMDRAVDATNTLISQRRNEYTQRLDDLEDLQGGAYLGTERPEDLAIRAMETYQDIRALRAQATAFSNRRSELYQREQRRQRAEYERRQAMAEAERAALAEQERQRYVEEARQRRIQAEAEQQRVLAVLDEKGLQPQAIDTIEGAKKIIQEKAATAAIKATTELESDDDYIGKLVNHDYDTVRRMDQRLEQITGNPAITTADFVASAYEFYDANSGLIAKVFRVSEDGSALYVRGNILNLSGDNVGEFARTIRSDGSVYHNIFQIKDEYQKSGFGSAFYQNSERVYIAAGLKRVTVHANITVGGYSWARMGFDCDSQSENVSFVNRVRQRWLARYPETPFPDISHIYEVAALVGPDGEKIGKQTLLGSNWHGHKDLNDNYGGFAYGWLYYAAKGEERAAAQAPAPTVQKEYRAMSRRIRTTLKGGEGSGFFGHAGIPGHHGGSRARGGGGPVGRVRSGPPVAAFRHAREVFHVAPAAVAPPRPTAISGARLHELELARRVAAKVSPSMYEVSLGARRAVLLSDGQVMWSEGEQYHTPMYARLLLEHEVDISKLDRAARTKWTQAIERAKQVIERDTVEDSMLENFAKELLGASSLEWLARGDYDEDLSAATKPFFRIEGHAEATEAEVRYLFRRVQRMFERGILDAQSFDTIEVTGGGARGEFAVAGLDQIAGIRKQHIPDTHFWEWEVILKEINETRRALAETLKGGPGSGFRGHRGRPGQKGGSLPRGAGDAPAPFRRAEGGEVYEARPPFRPTQYARPATRYTAYASAEHARVALLEAVRPWEERRRDLDKAIQALKRDYRVNRFASGEYAAQLRELSREKRQVSAQITAATHAWLDGMRAEVPARLRPTIVARDEFIHIFAQKAALGEIVKPNGTPFRPNEYLTVGVLAAQRYCLDFAQGMDPAEREMSYEVAEGVRVVRSYLEDRGVGTTKTKDVRLAADKAAQEGYYMPSEDIIVGIGIKAKDLLRESIFHEMGHWYGQHAADPGIGQRVRAFYDRRTAGEPEVELRPGSGVRVKKDRWLDPYSGRDYSSGETEVLSSGFELFFSSTYTFAIKDPEHFNLTVSILRGIPEQ